MVAGVIPYASLPSPLPAGFAEACETALANAGFPTLIVRAPDGVHVSDVATVTKTISAYTGSAAELAYHKAQKQAALDDLLDNHFSEVAFIRNGIAINVTAAQEGAFKAGIKNNYRTIRAAIAAGTTVAIVNAIDATKGWPANP